MENTFRTLARYPDRLNLRDFLPRAYYYMYLSRRMEERIMELFRASAVKGTVTISIGNEATTVGMAMPFRPGRDVVSLLQRDFGAHLVNGQTPYRMMSQYVANADSPTRGREGNVHHGDASVRRFPMVSHLGNMLATVVGGVWAARRNGEDAFGLAAIGDGGSSTGDFHESLNFASVRKVPVVYLIENNRYAYSTPTRLQYHCADLSDRAAGYGIEGRTIDGTDAWTVYSAVMDALERMHREPLPCIIECKSIRIMGHAAYDKAEYVSAEEKADILSRDPLPRTRARLIAEGGMPEPAVAGLEKAVETEVEDAIDRACAAARPSTSQSWSVFAPSAKQRIEPFTASKCKNLGAVNQALRYILAHEPRAFLLGQDIGPFGSAFKSCKGLFDEFGPDRVIDTPICESATTGFALGASQTGGRPIVEYQFADFSTEACTQIGINTATWFFRAEQPAPVLLRLPCGAGITLGAFHSGEFEGLWSRFPGLKLLYPFTTQETFEAIIAGFYDPNPCIVFEHKLLYGSQGGDIDFDGNVNALWRARCYREGNDITVLTWGAMARTVIAAAEISKRSIEVWNPFVLSPLDIEPLAASVKKTGRLLVVQEAQESSGFGSHLIYRLAGECFGALKCAPRLVAGPDMPVPFAPELEKFYIPSVEKILQTIDVMTGGSL